MLYIFIIDIFLYFAITNHLMKLEVVIVFIREIMAMQILWDNSVPLGRKGKIN